MEKLLVSVSEFAAAAGVSKPTAYQLVNSKGFPQIRAGRRILIPVSALEKWIEEQARNGGQL